MPANHRTTRRVEFHQTDAAGIVHFPAFFTYMEETEHELPRQLGLSVMMEDEQGRLSWRREAARCDFSGMARFEDVLDVEVSIQRIGNTSVTYGFCFTRQGEEIAQGVMTSVCCRLSPGQAPRGIRIPDWIRAKLQDA